MRDGKAFKNCDSAVSMEYDFFSEILMKKYKKTKSAKSAKSAESEKKSAESEKSVKSPKSEWRKIRKSALLPTSLMSLCLIANS